MNIDDEFATIDTLLAPEAETQGVDAFALALIKAERQMIKLFTYVLFSVSGVRPRRRQIAIKATRLAYTPIRQCNNRGQSALTRWWIRSLAPQLEVPLADKPVKRDGDLQGKLFASVRGHICCP
jgi:hypothetical protein